MRKFFLIIFIASPLFAFCQKKVNHLNLLWVNYQNSAQLNKKWSIVTDIQFRTNEITRSWLLFAVRPGLSYKLNEKYKIAAGFCWFGVHVVNSEKFILRNEWRPWQDVIMQQKIGKTDFLQRLRLEERFLPLTTANNGKSFELVFRLRYKFDFDRSINNTKWGVKLGDEIMCNPGFIGSSRFFDQNRAYAALGYNFNDHFQCNLMYMKTFQWRYVAEILEDQNVIRINFNHQLSFKK